MDALIIKSFNQVGEKMKCYQNSLDTVKTMHLETNEMIPFSNIQFKYMIGLLYSPDLFLSKYSH